MFFALIGAAIGVYFGIRRARKAGGNRFDIWQYAAVYGVFFALLGLALAVVVVRFF